MTPCYCKLSISIKYLKKKRVHTRYTSQQKQFRRNQINFVIYHSLAVLFDRGTLTVLRCCCQSIRSRSGDVPRIGLVGQVRFHCNTAALLPTTHKINSISHIAQNIKYNSEINKSVAFFNAHTFRDRY